MTDKKTDSDRMWDEVANLKVDVYGLPNQRVQDHVARMNIPSPKLFLKLKSAAVLPALEEAFGKKFAVELNEGGYVTVSRTEPAVETAVQAELQRLANPENA